MTGTVLMTDDNPSGECDVLTFGGENKRYMVSERPAMTRGPHVSTENFIEHIQHQDTVLIQNHQVPEKIRDASVVPDHCAGSVDGQLSEDYPDDDPWVASCGGKSQDYSSSDGGKCRKLSASGALKRKQYMLNTNETVVGSGAIEQVDATEELDGEQDECFNEDSSVRDSEASLLDGGADVEQEHTLDVGSSDTLDVVTSETLDVGSSDTLDVVSDQDYSVDDGICCTTPSVVSEPSDIILQEGFGGNVSLCGSCVQSLSRIHTDSDLSCRLAEDDQYSLASSYSGLRMNFDDTFLKEQYKVVNDEDLTIQEEFEAICKDDLNAEQLQRMLLKGHPQNSLNGHPASYPQALCDNSQSPINPFNSIRSSSSHLSVHSAGQMSTPNGTAAGAGTADDLAGNSSDTGQTVDLLHNLESNQYSSVSAFHRIKQVQSLDNISAQKSLLSSRMVSERNRPGQISWSDALLVQIPATLLGSMVLNHTKPVLPRVQSMHNFGFNTGGSYLGWQGIYDVYETPREDSEQKTWRSNIPRDWYIPLVNVSIITLLLLTSIIIVIKID